VFGEDPPNPPFLDELAHLADAALLLPEAEVEPAVLVSPAHVPGVHPAAPRLPGRRLRVLVVLEDRLLSGRTNHQLPDLTCGDRAIVLVEDVHLDQALWRLAEGPDW